MASLFCGSNVPDWVQLDCGLETGGVIAIVIIDADQHPTLANLREASFWTSKFNASPQKYRLIEDVRGSYPGGTPTEIAGFGRASTIRTSAEHELQFFVPGILDNWGFWEGVNQTAKWNFAWISNEGIGHYVEAVSIYTKDVVEEDIKSLELWNGSVKWSNISNPQVFEAPSAIFG